MTILFEDREHFLLDFVPFVIDELERGHLFDMDAFHDISTQPLGRGGQAVHREAGAFFGQDRDIRLGILEIVRDFDFGDCDKPTDARVVEPTRQALLEFLLDIGCDLQASASQTIISEMEQVWN